MTLARRTFLAICIALATALAVLALAAVGAESRPQAFEKLQRN